MDIKKKKNLEFKMASLFEAELNITTTSKRKFFFPFTKVQISWFTKIMFLRANL